MQNSYKPKFTYVIPFRYTQERMLPLRRVIEWLSGFQGIDILVIEQDKVSKIGHLNLKVRHIFVESEAPFNKAWAYNIAIRRTNSPIIIFGDADFIMNPNDLIESLKTLEFFDCILPVNNIVKLTPNETNLDLPSIFNINRVDEKGSLVDGICIFKRDSIQKIGGWNEDIMGYGFVNTFQDMKIKKLLNYKSMNFNGYHFYHKPLFNDAFITKRNQEIIEFYSKDDADFNQHIQLTVPKSGFLNKYQY